MADQARARAHGEYNWRVFCERILELYDDLLGKTGSDHAGKRLEASRLEDRAVAHS